jgi:hypothetical protein
LADNDQVAGNPYLTSHRWQLAEQITTAMCQRWPADIRAIGVRGSLAHDDDANADDIDLLVVTYRPTDRPHPGTRRVEGAVVRLTVAAADEYLRSARVLSTDWPLTADRFLATRALYDPGGWYATLRDAHLGRLAEAGGSVFATLARDAWCVAEVTYAKALRLAEWHDTTGAMLTFGAARLAAATVEGLLTRTYFRDGADAVSRTGLGDADLTEVGKRLGAQADELAKRGRPVDGTVADLLR